MFHMSRFLPDRSCDAIGKEHAFPQTVRVSPLRIRRRPARRAPHRSKVNALAGLLTCGSSLGRTFPGLPPQWHMPTSLAAYSCGGSRGFEVTPAPRSLFTASRPAEPKHLQP